MPRSQTPRSLQPKYHQISSPSHGYNAYTPNTPSTSQNSTKREHPFTRMDSCHHHHHGNPLSSESGKFIKKWILYYAIPYPFDFWLYWDPTDPYDNKLLQEYVGSNGSVVYLPSSAIKSLINLWNYMTPLIKKEKSIDQKCNAQFFKMINGST